MNVKALILLLFTATQTLAQGFAGLGSEATGFALPDPDTRFEFPKDHGAHPGFRIEWWYITANLTGADGREYGVQWTLFRSALVPEAAPIWMGHAALTTEEAHYSTERFARDGTGQAGVTAQPFAAWIDDWQFSDGEALSARGLDFSYDLKIATDAPFVAQGDQGYSVKSPTGQASHYYSQPFYEVSGTVSLPEGAVEVTGMAWLDREWSSQPLAADQTGWDWFSLHLDSGEKLMGFRLRAASGEHRVATWIDADGTPHPEPANSLLMEPLQSTEAGGRRLPTRWRLRLPQRGFDITVDALNPDSWMDTTVAYWEGPVSGGGTHGARGYLEMTGYD